MARMFPLAGGPTPVSRRMLELWRGQQGEERAGQVSISAGDTTVHADRIVLMAWGDFSGTLYTSKFQDSQTCSISLEDSHGPVLLPLVEALYRQEVTITPDNVEGLMTLADRLQIGEITRACVAYMVDIMEEDPYLAIAMMQRCSLIHVQQEVLQAMLPHLQRRSAFISPEVISMLTDGQLVELVSADSLDIINEMKVAEYLESRKQARGHVPAEAYKAVRVEHMSTEELSELILMGTPLLERAVWALARLAGDKASPATPHPTRNRRCTAPEYLTWTVYGWKCAARLDKPVICQRFCPHGFNEFWEVKIRVATFNGMIMSLYPLHETGLAYLGTGACFELEDPNTGSKMSWQLKRKEEFRPATDVETETHTGLGVGESFDIYWFRSLPGTADLEAGEQPPNFNPWKDALKVTLYLGDPARRASCWGGDDTPGIIVVL